MAGSDSQPKKATPPKPAVNAERKPLQVMHISRKTEDEIINKESPEEEISDQSKDKRFEEKVLAEREISQLKKAPEQKKIIRDRPVTINEANTTKDLFRSETISDPKNIETFAEQNNFEQQSRTVDEFDFDEGEFLAALEDNQPIGTTGEIAKGSVITVESDGIYVDIGGKAPGFMPKNECGLGVITNLKERFPKLDNMYLLDILIEKKGHAGKATQAIFKAGGEGVQEAEEQFYKVYSGAFIDRIITGLKMVYLWNIDYDGSFCRNRKSIKTVDKDGNEEELFELDSFLFTPGDTRYENHDYFEMQRTGGQELRPVRLQQDGGDVLQLRAIGFGIVACGDIDPDA